METGMIFIMALLVPVFVQVVYYEPKRHRELLDRIEELERRLDAR